MEWCRATKIILLSDPRRTPSLYRHQTKDSHTWRDNDRRIDRAVHFNQAGEKRMNPSKPVLGFDRKIALTWLDATLQLVADDLSSNEIRNRLDAILDGQVAGTAHNSARGKTKTVLLHIWVNVPSRVVKLRDKAIQIAHTLDDEKKVALHWGMCIATYPVFLDIALTTGRLLQMQDEVPPAQIQRRIAESWGERSTLTRAVQRVLRNFVDWDVLQDADSSGKYAAAPKIDLTQSIPLELWLLEAFMVGNGLEIREFKDILAAPCLFPFRISLSSANFEGHSGLEFARQGVSSELVIMK